MTPEMLNLEWNAVALYPAGYFSRDITCCAGDDLAARVEVRHARSTAPRSARRPRCGSRP